MKNNLENKSKNSNIRDVIIYVYNPFEIMEFNYYFGTWISNLILPFFISQDEADMYVNSVA